MIGIMRLRGILLFAVYSILMLQLIKATTESLLKEPVDVKSSFLGYGMLKVVIRRNNEKLEAIVSKRSALSRGVDFITVDGTEIVIPESRKTQYFDGIVLDCFNCNSSITLFDDGNKVHIYGIFEFPHQKLYLESTSFDEQNYYLTHVPKTRNINSPWQQWKVINKKLCPMSVNFDNEFYQKVGSDHSAVYRYITATIEFNNYIYKNVVFGNTESDENSTGIQFGLARLTIENVTAIYDNGSEILVDTNNLLFSFAKVIKSSDVCLAVMITGRYSTIDGNIGSSFTGYKRKDGSFSGVCGDKKSTGESTNTVAMSMVSNGFVVPVFDGHRYLAHEIAHLIGAWHDDEGETLMTSVTTNGNRESHFHFPPKEQKRMEKVLSGVKFRCFEAIVDTTEHHLLYQCILLISVVVFTATLIWIKSYGSKPSNEYIHLDMAFKRSPQEERMIETSLPKIDEPSSPTVRRRRHSHSSKLMIGQFFRSRRPAILDLAIQHELIDLHLSNRFDNDSTTLCALIALIHKYERKYSSDPQLFSIFFPQLELNNLQAAITETRITIKYPFITCATVDDKVVFAVVEGRESIHFKSVDGDAFDALDEFFKQHCLFGENPSVYYKFLYDFIKELVSGEKKTMHQEFLTELDDESWSEDRLFRPQLRSRRETAYLDNSIVSMQQHFVC